MGPTISGVDALLLRVTNHLLKQDREMPLTRLQILMLVSRRDGCLVRDLVIATGLNQSTIARQLAHLGNKPTKEASNGLQWIEMVPDHEDPRRVRCHLTPKGKQLISEIETLAN